MGGDACKLEDSWPISTDPSLSEFRFRWKAEPSNKAHHVLSIYVKLYCIKVSHSKCEHGALDCKVCSEICKLARIWSRAG
jgi:hypothetical protein